MRVPPKANNGPVSKPHEWHGYGRNEHQDCNGQVLAKAKKDLGNEIPHADPPAPW